MKKQQRQPSRLRSWASAQTSLVDYKLLEEGGRKPRVYRKWSAQEKVTALEAVEKAVCVCLAVNRWKLVTNGVVSQMTEAHVRKWQRVGVAGMVTKSGRPSVLPEELLPTITEAIQGQISAGKQVVCKLLPACVLP